jgi:hypothetical protein
MWRASAPCNNKCSSTLPIYKYRSNFNRALSLLKLRVWVASALLNKPLDTGVLALNPVRWVSNWALLPPNKPKRVHVPPNKRVTATGKPVLKLVNKVNAQVC